jgi:hypothetical protein
MSDDKCYKPDDLKIPPNFADTAESILDKLGYDKECIKDMKTVYGELQAGGEAGLMGIGDAKTHLETSAGASSLYEKGCGTIMSSLMKVATKISQAQCIMRKNEAKVETSTSTENVIIIQTVKPVSDGPLLLNYTNLFKDKLGPRPQTLTADEQTQLMNQYLPYATAAMIANKTVLSPDDFLKNRNEERLNAQNLWDKADKEISKSAEDLFNYSLTINDSTITQKINQSVKGSIQLSSEDQQELKNTVNSITDIISQMKLEKEQGFGASEGSTNTQSTTNVASTYNMNSQVIDSKLQNIKASFVSGNRLEITVNGPIKMTNVTIDQDLVSNIALDLMISSAVTTGITSASVLLTKAKSEMDVSQQSEGIEAMIKAIKDGQAKVAEANAINPLNRLIMAIAGVAIFAILVFGLPRLAAVEPFKSMFSIFGRSVSILPNFDVDSPGKIAFKIFMIVLLFVTIFLIVYFTSKPSVTINQIPPRNEFGIQPIPLETSKFNRRNLQFKDDPSKYNQVYNKVWKGKGCTKELTSELIDYNKWDFKPDQQVSNEIENLINNSMICGVYNTENDICKYNFVPSFAGKTGYDGYKTLRTGFEFLNTTENPTCFRPKQTPTEPVKPPTEEEKKSQKVYKLQFGFFTPKKQFLHVSEIQGHFIKNDVRNTSIISPYSTNTKTKYTAVGEIYSDKTKDPNNPMLLMYGPEKVGDRDIDTFIHTTDKEEIKYVQIVLPVEKEMSSIVIANRQGDTTIQNRIIGAQLKLFNQAGFEIFVSEPIKVSRKYYEWKFPFNDTNKQDVEYKPSS